jgi:hypothetical protein
MLEDRIDQLNYWVSEREQVRVRKESGAPWPWSADVAFQTIRFCNVHREDDRVTRWIATNWREPFCDSIFMTTAMVIARLVNLPETLDELPFPVKGWNPTYRATFIDTLASRKRRGEKVWTNAYMVTGGYSKGGESKEVIIARVLDGAARVAEQVWSCGSLAEADKILTVPGLGSFLRAQVIADLKNTPVLKGASDWWSWCNPGPGSTAGMNILLGRDKLSSSIPLQTFRDNVRTLASPHNLCAQDTQNVLCEFSKWWKFTMRGTRPKNRYHVPN